MSVTERNSIFKIYEKRTEGGNVSHSFRSLEIYIIRIDLIIMSSEITSNTKSNSNEINIYPCGSNK